MRSLTVLIAILFTLTLLTMILIAGLVTAQGLINQRVNAAIVTIHDRLIERENQDSSRELLRQSEIRAAEDAANDAILEAASAAIFDHLVSDMVAASLK